MLKSAKAMLLATATVVGIAGQPASGASIPTIIDFEPQFAQFGLHKAVIGADGNSRFLWDSFTGSVTTYVGSELWIVSPTSQVVAVGKTQIPASVGTGISGVTLGIPASNTALNVSPSGNTTIARS